MATQSEISAIFARYGVPTSMHADGSTEDGAARLARLEASGRSLADIEAAVRQIAAAQGIGTQPVAGAGQAFNGVGGSPELWLYEPTGWYFLTYFVPGTNIPILYTTSPQEAQTLVGPGNPISPTRVVTSEAELKSTGAVGFGYRRQIDSDTENPFETWASQVAAQSAVRPWLRDREVLAIIATAQLEGRPMSGDEWQARLSQTDWWQNHSEAQRNWMALSEGDPATAAQVRSEQIITLRNMFRQAGSANVPEQVLSQMADQYLTGMWTQSYLIDQVKALADPASGIPVDPLIMGAGVDTTHGQELEVGQLFARWLGPIYGRDQGSIASWAGRLRNDPDAQGELIKHLQAQRLAMFPEYDNPNLSYEDVVGPWRGFWSQQWGQPADETDPLFSQVVRSGDSTVASKLMREQGITRGVPKVMNDLTAFGASVAGPQVRSLG